MVDWVVVGAGFTGATLAERIASQRNERVLVVERRNHIGGNAHDRRNAAGLLVHQYGPHIFHTNSLQVWDYLRPFSDWRPYEHRVRASIDGQLVPLPFNLNTIDAVFPVGKATRYATLLTERYGEGGRIPILKLMALNDPHMRELSTFIYEKVFLTYTIKQWGLRPEELSPSVTARVPVLVSRDDRYFQDKVQQMPAAGYTALFDRMLNHPNISLLLGTDYRAIATRYPSARIIFTGPIDEFFNYQFGQLPYRTIRFQERMIEAARFQPVGTVNYPGKEPYTRITEMKHLTGETGPRSALLYEYATAHIPGVTEPYYPIPQGSNQTLLNRYLELAQRRDDVFFCGRLGDYRYYNMDQAVGAALALFRTICKVDRMDNITAS
ncbi:UDP-galactopyranose mutase [Mesorhizobium sp. M7A.F.Ca.US.011.01.1.1]|uniref:UDP-galactopyranose mutase n=1 Tax=Mesorhizobium sp. M7A.F.Ca.US.011.01.1.1 TaxID=2496741 RepID=UPI000FCADB96|nr:UDP-galactopyranose mutase [Mesorhizobium sp. M7A.F.Ca.US.011.01.1.1]RUX25376.1 UDP-galactopyranose mutase [Mesorhizobium sp. M7A.F.Ca.US.011.01.1.1]